MKPTDERCQAATKVNALSPEIDDVEKADSVGELEGSMAYSEMASRNGDRPINGKFLRSFLQKATPRRAAGGIRK